MQSKTLLILTLLAVLISACDTHSTPALTEAPPPAQRATGNDTPKPDAAEEDASAATQEVEAIAAEAPGEEAAAAEPAPDATAWLAISPTAGLFGGGVLYSCHDIEITRSTPPSEELIAALADPPLANDLIWAIATVRWPAEHADLTDLEALANAVFAPAATLCSPEAFGDVWDADELAALPSEDTLYLTGIAHLVEDDAEPYWLVRIGIVTEETAS
jgi:hypothetical protein